MRRGEGQIRKDLPSQAIYPEGYEDDLTNANQLNDLTNANLNELTGGNHAASCLGSHRRGHWGGDKAEDRNRLGISEFAVMLNMSAP